MKIPTREEAYNAYLPAAQHQPCPPSLKEKLKEAWLKSCERELRTTTCVKDWERHPLPLPNRTSSMAIWSAVGVPNVWINEDNTWGSMNLPGGASSPTLQGAVGYSYDWLFYQPKYYRDWALESLKLSKGVTLRAGLRVVDEHGNYGIIVDIDPKDSIRVWREIDGRVSEFQFAIWRVILRVAEKPGAWGRWVEVRAPEESTEEEP